MPRIRACLAVAGALPITASMPGCEEDAPAGQLRSLNDKADGGSGTTFLRAIFPNKREMLLPGGHVDVVLTLTTVTNAIVVPSESVQSGQQGKQVFVVEPDSTVEARPVQVRDQIGSNTILRAGVNTGEQIVTTGKTQLTSGMKVRIQNPMSIAVNANR